MWEERRSKPVQLLCDARSTPPRIAAVCICDGLAEYADAEPHPHVLEQFRIRDDGQIASLEMLAVALGKQHNLGTACQYRKPGPLAGLSTFKSKLKGRNVVVHTDNTIAEYGLRKGRARSFDHACVVHAIW